MTDFIPPLSLPSMFNDPASLAAPMPAGAEFARMLAALLTTAAQPQQFSPPAAPAPMPQLAGGMSGFDSLGLLLYLSLLEELSKLSAPAAPNPQPSMLPVSGRLSQDFHARHGGIDIAVPTGTPVQSTMPGKVVHAGWNEQGYGYLVVVENGPYQTYYAHMKEMPAVRAGDFVTTGQVLGLSGSTGNSTGPHVHYEVRVDGQNVSPWEYAGAHPHEEH